MLPQSKVALEEPVGTGTNVTWICHLFGNL